MQRSNSKPSIIVGGADRKMFETGGFSKRRFSKDYSPGGIGKKMGSNKMATLSSLSSNSILHVLSNAVVSFRFSSIVFFS